MSQFYRSASDVTTETPSSTTDRRQERQKGKSTIKAFGLFIYNKKKRTVCNRTLRNWAILIFFYIIFLGILFGLFFGLLMTIIHMLMTSRVGPMFSKTDLLADPSPALAVFPRLPITTTSLVWYTRKGNPSEHIIHPSYYIDAISSFLEPYDDVEPKRYVDCESATVPPRDGQYCAFTRADLKDCGDTNSGYGYKIDCPCIYLKLNMIEDWKPSRKRRKHFVVRHGDNGGYRSASSNETVASEEEFNRSGSRVIYTDEIINVKCEGVTTFDEEHMGKMTFYPQNGFKEYFFPYDGSADYRRPLIGLKFQNMTKGLVIGVKCFITDIENMKNPILHSVSFYLYIDRE